MDKNEPTLFLPDLCGLRPLFVIVVVGELIALIITLAVAGATSTAFDYFALISLLTQWIGLSSAAALCLSRRYLGRFSEKTAVFSSYLTVMLVIAGIAEAAWRISRESASGPIIEIEHTDFLIRVLTIGAIATALILRYFYVQHHWRVRTISEAGARLEALQARIRPHFLFNCMNSIASLTRTNPAGAEKAIEDLSDLFRASMNDQRTVASLQDEFELVRRYVDIEALRLGDRLQIAWQIAPEILTQEIPMLTIQPLVENAIYHGIEPLAQGGEIVLRAFREKNKIHVRITNPVTDLTTPQHRGNQIALDNVEQRLLAHYGPSAKVTIDAEEDAYTVTLTIPVREEV